MVHFNPIDFLFKINHLRLIINQHQLNHTSLQILLIQFAIPELESPKKPYNLSKYY